MRLQPKSFLSPVPYVVCLLLFAGGIAGNWIGEKYRLHTEKADARAYADTLIAHGERILSSARKTIDGANQSKFEMCSPEDLAYQRELVFAAYHIKDIGRLQDDSLVCSTLLRDISEKPRRSGEDVLLRDGTYVYRDKALITPGSHGPILGRDKANVVLSPTAFDAFFSPQFAAFSVFIANEERTNFASIYHYPPAQRVGDNLVSWVQDDTGEPEAGLGEQIERCGQTSPVCAKVVLNPDWVAPSTRILPILFTGIGTLLAGVGIIAWLNLRSRGRTLNAMLRKALTAKSLSLVYQPIVDLADRKLVGFEALVRWEITKGEFVPPEMFIARAETTDLADKITFFVLDRMIDEMGELLRNDRSLRVNINLTANNLQNLKFPSLLEKRLHESDIDAQQVGLELTERNAVDFIKSANCIQQLREQGHRIYIDDFGTGYSSLAYLGELNVDAIKIDKAFIRALGNNCEDVSIVPQIVTMAQKYGLDVVVEGVETTAQWENLRKLHVGLTGQGWLFGKPMNSEAAHKLIADRARNKKRARSTKKVVNKN